MESEIIRHAALNCSILRVVIVYSLRSNYILSCFFFTWLFCSGTTNQPHIHIYTHSNKNEEKGSTRLAQILGYCLKMVKIRNKGLRMKLPH